MKKSEYLKQNWIIALMWNIPIAFVASIITRSATSAVFPNIIIPIATLLFFIERDLNNWHTEERIDELEKEIKQLKDDNK